MCDKLKEKLKDDCKLCDSKGYFSSYKDNIFGHEMGEAFQNMFNDGSGSELHSKAEAVHSSSMLSYNFFHWIDEEHPFVFEDVIYTKVLFEVKLKTIKGRANPANMDVVLLGKKDEVPYILFIESKFLEYTQNSQFELRDSYKDGNRWYDSSVDWNAVIESVPKEKGYLDGIKQTITHLFGIHSTIATHDCKSLSGFDWDNGKYKFINCIFKPNSEYAERKAYDDYEKIYRKYISKVNNKGLKVVPEWFSYTDIWHFINPQISEQLRDYLCKRYMKYSDI